MSKSETEACAGRARELLQLMKDITGVEAELVAELPRSRPHFKLTPSCRFMMGGQR